MQGGIRGTPKVLVELEAIIDENLNKEQIKVDILGQEQLTLLGVRLKDKSWYGELDQELGRGTENFHLSNDNRLTGLYTIENVVCAHVSSKEDGKVLAECIQQSDFEIELDPEDLPDIDSQGQEIATDPKGLKHHDIMIVYTLDAMCAEAGLSFPCEITSENKAPI